MDGFPGYDAPTLKNFELLLPFLRSVVSLSSMGLCPNGYGASL